MSFFGITIKQKISVRMLIPASTIKTVVVFDKHRCSIDTYVHRVHSKIQKPRIKITLI